MKRTPLRKNSYLKWGTVLLLLLLLTLYFTVDQIIMPGVTRQRDIVTVPDYYGMRESDALEEISSADLVHDGTTYRIGPDSLQGVVAHQTPRPDASVRPGRRVYLTVYRGSEPDVTVPDVSGLSLRNARLDLTAAGLVVWHEQPDSIPSPVPDIVTRTEPIAGSLVPSGGSVMIWYGRGMNHNQMIEVPNVVGQRYLPAVALLRPLFFWPELLDQEEDLENPVIRRQSPEPGELLPAGATIRLYATADSLDQE